MKPEGTPAPPDLTLVFRHLQGEMPDQWRQWAHRLDPPQLLRALLNVRPGRCFPPEIEAAVETYLDHQRKLRPVISPREIPCLEEPMALWRGDITTLAADAIVNAANEALLGCFLPLHSCIDNAIHSAAGPRLRWACAVLMKAQGHPEPVGRAQVTPGFQLPSHYVIHTVGPQVRGPVMEFHREGLVSCYRSVLEAAAALPEVRTLAFCSISTGVFGYPIRDAAPLAVNTVRQWLAHHPGRFDRVIFDVFSQEDEGAYRSQFAHR